MENYPKILCHMPLMSDNRHNVIIINVSWNIICFRVLMFSYNNVYMTPPNNVLWRHNPGYFVLDKLAITLFSYSNLQFIL